eukprot:m.58676 g.58676  ORF g.58676 m.58676 type:complete len:559 (-) comp9422_c0_seq1:207-1883(-)
MAAAGGGGDGGPSVPASSPARATVRPSSARPGTARVRISKTSSPAAMVNPAPKAPMNLAFNGDGSARISKGLTKERLQEVTGREDLASVTELKLIVDTTESSLGQFAGLVQSLVSLDLSGSTLTSIRDLGTGFHSLEVLKLENCKLSALDGITVFPKLRELSCRRNKISNLSPLGMVSQLTTLDLSENALDSIEQLDYLGLFTDLCSLSLSGNPFYSSFATNALGYRVAVCAAVPAVTRLDGRPILDFQAGPLPDAAPSRRGSLDRARRPMTAGAAVGGLRRRAGAEPDFSLLSAATAAADDAILGAAPRKPEQPTVALCGSPLKALRAHRRSSGPEASAAAPAAPPPDVWRADDAPTDDGAGAAVPTAVVEPPSTKPTTATASVDPMVDADFLETSDELDAMMASVGIAPIRKVSEAVVGEAPGTDVIAELKKWRVGFDAKSSPVAAPAKPSGAPSRGGRSRMGGDGSGAKAGGATRPTPRPPAGPRPPAQPRPPGKPRSSGGGRPRPRTSSGVRRLAQSQRIQSSLSLDESRGVGGPSSGMADALAATSPVRVGSE